MNLFGIKTLGAIIALLVGVTAEAKTLVYYYGEPQMTDLSSGRVRMQKVLFKRITDPDSGYILEDAYSQTTGNTQCVHAPAYIVFEKDGSVTLTDVIDGSTKPTFHGTGTVQGPAWAWNYLKFSIKFLSSNPQQNGMTIEDTNFILPDQTLIARKMFFLPGAKAPFMLYDGTYDVVAEERYKDLFQQMGCSLAN